jgi:hypothetical protein
MFLLYHSEGCNICELVLHECYVNDLYATTCSVMLGHHNLIMKFFDIREGRIIHHTPTKLFIIKIHQ